MKVQILSGDVLAWAFCSDSDADSSVSDDSSRQEVSRKTEIIVMKQARHLCTTDFPEHINHPLRADLQHFVQLILYHVNYQYTQHVPC